MIEFWAVPSHPSSNVAHAYMRGHGGKLSALCRSPLQPSETMRWEKPGCIACRKCLRLVLKNGGQGVLCPDCGGLGYKRVRYLRSGPASQVRCRTCDRLGWVWKDDGTLFKAFTTPSIPDPPTRPNSRPWLP